MPIFIFPIKTFNKLVLLKTKCIIKRNCWLVIWCYG